MKARRQPVDPGAWAKFRLLMWKNFLQQWRHRGQTVLELLLPVATMSLVLIMRSQIDPINVDTMRYHSINANTLNFSPLVIAGMNITHMSIAYSPKNNILDEVVRSAMLKLLLVNFRFIIGAIKKAHPELVAGLPDLPDSPGSQLPPVNNVNTTKIYEFLRKFVKVQAYNHSSELRAIYADENTTRVVLAAVEFPDKLHDATQLPIDITYSLRFPERPRMNSFYNQGWRTWRTDSIFPLFELPGPRFPHSWEGGIDPGYVNEVFIALQHMVSSELISRITGTDMFRFRLHFQRYPHPPYTQDLSLMALQYLFAMFIMLSFSYTAVNIVRAITVEKELQLKETMKIMGLSTWLHWTAWFWKQFLYLLISTVLIVVILKVNWFTNEQGFSDYAVFSNTPWTVLFFFLLLYLTCMIFFCFMLSGFFSKGSTAALFTGVIWFLTYVPAFLLSMDVSMSTTVEVLTCLSINSAMSNGFQLLLAKESTGGMQWGEFMLSPTTDSTRFVFGHVVIMLAVDCVLYMLIALYLEQVRPGPFGSPRPWYFLFQKQFWCSSYKSIDDVVVDNDDVPVITKEKDPTGHSIGVKMINLTKMFGANFAVNKLNLNIYDDQITVLLGHNGAGKSTTIAMLTGNVEVTHGSVWVAGYDVSKQIHAARSHIGLCPQHNVLFNELTVREHLEFFARLKGFTGHELSEDIDTLIDKLELQEKRNYQSQGLSGGQKRRLSVGIALSGAARVVLLDEPTSGMDPSSRRALWDLLQKEKKGRSMILTTHFMDEADILGDRVAIMANGRLQCVGSPYFLKRHYGVGYTLVVVKNEGFQEDVCTAVINKYIPGTTVKEDRGTEVTYSLTNDYSHVFEDILNDLESNAAIINFKNYGFIATTMEDVFMSVGSDVVQSTISESDDDGATATGTDYSGDDTYKSELESSLRQFNNEDGSITGWPLFGQHVLAVWFKLWVIWTRSWPLLALQLVAPLVLIVSTLGVMYYVSSFAETIQRRELTLTDGFTSTETFLNFNGTSKTSLGALATAAYKSMFTSANIPTMQITTVENTLLDDYYLKRTADRTMMGVLRNRLLTGATFEDNGATAWFSNFGYHDIATSLAAVHTALLKASNPDANLVVYNHPLEAHYSDQSNMQTIVAFLSMQLSSGIGSSVGIVSAVFVVFYIKERVSRAKLLQKVAGISPVTLWFSTGLFDWTFYLIICVTIVISCVAFQVIGLSTFEELGRMYLCLMVYGAAMLPLTYLCSYLFNGPALGFVALFFVNVLFGMMGAQIVDALWAPQLDTKATADILDAIFQFFPLYSLITAVRFLNRVALQRYTCLRGCEFLSAVMPDINECTMKVMCGVYPDECCIPEHPYWNWKEPGVMRYIVCMIFTGTILWLILMFSEYRIYRKIFNREKKPPPVDENTLDEDVVDEMRHVDRVRDTGLGDSSLIVSGLSKYYGKNLAVDQVSFTVSDGECFGLLGVNGAGKTTTFKMLMGDEAVSSGDAFVSAHSVKRAITKVHENIGYCPQFDAVFGEMTGRENLRYFCILRGIKPQRAAAGTEVLAQALGFFKHLDKKVDQYSGGNKRKLSTAVALLGRTRLVFVDEPTTGVDPAAKRKVWSAMRIAQRAGRGIVLTSHSMEECEALCSRLTIMVNGRFRCLGTPQHLKNKFSQGFTLTIKLKLDGDVTTDTSSTDAVKNYINSNFHNPIIMEEYQGLLTYYLPDRSMPWSRMFGVMERAKRELEVEDYSIAQTTLEQIFLQFTKYQRENRLS